MREQTGKLWNFAHLTAREGSNAATCTWTRRSAVVRDWWPWPSRLWWEIPIKVSGRLITIQSSGGHRIKRYPRVSARFSSALLSFDVDRQSILARSNQDRSLFLSLSPPAIFPRVEIETNHLDESRKKREVSKSRDRTRGVRSDGARECWGTREPPARKTSRDR